MALKDSSVEEKHIDWSAKQSRILTDRGNAIEYYSEKNGFPFSAEECPHYHLERGETDVFKKWSQDFLASGTKQPIVGVWKRPLFASKWEHSTDADETVYNIQTSTLFIDLRIPRSRPVTLESRQSLERLSNHELRMFARQHVFGGFSALSSNNNRPLCTRHHCIDWNYIPSKPRPRPNKWYIECNSATSSQPCDAWIEWSFAADTNGQSYYHERWERLPGDELGEGLRLAMRKKRNSSDKRDGIIVVVGDHFNYMIGRDSSDVTRRYPNASNLVELVDASIVNEDRSTAISLLSLKGGHGTISSGWTVDCSIQPWMSGKSLLECIEDDEESTKFEVFGDGLDFRMWDVVLGSSVWEIYECSLSNVLELKSLLQVNLDSRL